MKYIYIVMGLILIVLGISGITFLKAKPPASKELVKVNERVITIDEFKKAYGERASSSPVPVDKKRFLEELITREILIQEAKRLGLDLKEPFRRSIQNYYEQTLLKNLAQERMSEIQASVSEEEISSYYKNMGKVYELRIIMLPTEHEANEAIRNFPLARAEKKLLRVEEIPQEIKDAVGELKIGEISKKPVPCDRGFFVFKLEGHKMEHVPPLAEIHDEIKKTLEEKKRRAGMEKWLDGLKKKSRITINEALLR